MASDGEKEWPPQQTENNLGEETTTTTTTSTGYVVATHHTTQSNSRLESFHNAYDFGAPSQTENYGSTVKNDAGYERPGLHHTQTSSTEMEDDKDLQMQRTQTSRSVRERRQFAPIRTGDAEELTRIATLMEGDGASVAAARTSTRGSELQRRDTLAGINVGDSVLDPKSPDFDPYKWARM